jgi:hypothetical protein
MLAALAGCHGSSSAQPDPCKGESDGATCSVQGAAGACKDGMCIAFACGDGVVQDGEQCDGSDVGGKTCTDLGYYTPAGLACDASCQLDVTGCTGMCGDHVINGLETCDGAAPAGRVCTDDGFDVGALRCSSTCTESTVACGKIGWRHYTSPSLTISRLWGRAVHEYYATAEDGVLQFRSGVWNKAQGSPTNVVAIDGRSATDMYIATAGSPGALYSWDGATFTHLTDVGPALGAAVVEAKPNDVWILGDTLQHWNGTTLSSQAGPSGGPIQHAWWMAQDDIWAIGFFAGVMHYNGATWAAMTVPDIGGYTSMWANGPHDLWLGGVGTTAHYDGTSWQVIPIDSPSPNGGITLWGSGPNDVFAFGRNAGGPPYTTFVYRWDGARWIREDDLTFTVNAIWGFAGELMVEFNGTDFYGRGVAEWETATQSDPSFGVWFASADDGWAATSNRPGLVHWDGKTWSAPITTPDPIEPTNVWGTASTDVWVTGYGGIEHWDGHNWTTSLTFASSIQVGPIWGTSATNIWAITGNQFLHWNGATWTVVATPGNVPYVAIHGSGPGDIWAVGGYGLAHFNGTSWTGGALPGGQTFAAVWASAPDDAWLAGNNLIYHWDGTAWSASDIPVLAGFTAIHGTAKDDVFAVGQGATILHFDGTAWAPIRTPESGMSFLAVSALPQAVAFVGEPDGGASGITDVLLRHGRWACRDVETSCNDGIDDDCDGKVDREDSDCP